MEASEQKPAAGGGTSSPSSAGAVAPAQRQQPQQQAPQEDVERYAIAGWRERVRRFGDDVSPHAIAGALHDVAEDERLTEAEVRERLDRFHRRGGVEREDEE